MSKKHFVFVNNDIDGAGAFLILKWLTNKKDLPYKTVSRNSFPNVYDKWSKQVNVDDIDHIYVFDLDVTDFVEMIPQDKLVVIDNDPYHDPSKYKSGTKAFIDNEKTSTAKSVYDLFNDRFDNELTTEQKILMLLIDDNASYNFSLKGSYELGLIFDNYQGDQVKKFIADFASGYTGFTSKQQSVIKFYKDKLNKIKSDLDVFSAKLPIGGNPIKFVSTFSNSFINEVSDWLLKDFGADISIVINVNNNRVSFRRGKNCDVDLSKLAKKISNGGGKEYSAGGYLTEELMELSKTFKQVK